MKKLFMSSLLFIALVAAPHSAKAAGIGASGGGNKTVGQTFTVTVTASADSFDSLQGTISVSGPVSIVSFSAGGATWLPGKSPADGQQFVGITSATNSLTVAKITLKATKEGSGSVSVGGVKLAKSGSVVGSDGGSTSFTVKKAPTPPGAIKVTSSTHPDSNQNYEAPTIELAWEKPSGVTEFSYLLDQNDNTTPPAQKTSSDTSAKYENKPPGVYYFHIRGKNSDGWGSTTHFKININEPPAKINESLGKPVIKKITKAATFKTDIETGTAAGIEFSGTAPVGYKLLLSLTPKPTLSEGTILAVEPDESGNWKYLLETPIPAGFYILTAQSEKDKEQSPVSEPVRFEISLADGGSIHILTAKDAAKAVAKQDYTPGTANESKVLGYAKQPMLWFTLLFLIGLAIGGGKIYKARTKRLES